MIRPPKALSIGALDHGEFKILYCGDDVVKGMEPLEKNPADCLQIFFFRNGALRASRETEAMRVIRSARLAAAEKASKEQHEKTLAEAKAKAEEFGKAAAEAKAKAQAEAAERAKADAKAKAASDAEILKAAASKAAAKAK
jgi:hypothetical protein